MRCGYCDEEITSEDPNYGLADIHSSCALKLQDEMAHLGLIKIVSRAGNVVAWTLTGTFEKLLYKTLDEVYSYISRDVTVDDDLVEMLGTIKAVRVSTPDSTPPKKIWFFVGFIFNGIMRQKYGVALPKNKMFLSRAEEFLREMATIPIGKEEVERFKTVFDSLSSTSRPEEKVCERRGLLVGIPEVDMELDAKLDRASDQVLDAIEEIALKMEEKYGASTTWRGFRMDELLLQTIRDMIVTHLQSFPTKFETSLTKENEDKLAASLKSLLTSMTEVVSTITREHNLPFDVVLARLINNMIANLVMTYTKIKLDYAKNHGML